ncbi:MAG: hypothetical protein KDC53_15465 [Saprospiraceae bacterium]|nr:hypothetical protein [Saprospiraceae bacterium]
MSTVQIVRAYQKQENAVFKLESVNDNPLNPIRTAYVTKPFRSIVGKFRIMLEKAFRGESCLMKALIPNRKRHLT